MEKEKRSSSVDWYFSPESFFYGIIFDQMKIRFGNILKASHTNQVFTLYQGVAANQAKVWVDQVQ